MSDLDLNQYQPLLDKVKEIVFSVSNNIQYCKLLATDGTIILGSAAYKPSSSIVVDALFDALEKYAACFGENLTLNDLCFNDAFAAMVNGNYIARKEWSGNLGESWLALVNAETDSLNPYFVYSTPSIGTEVGYRLSPADLLAKDWYIVPENKIKK